MTGIIVTDLDGTLLRPDKSIPDATVGVFARCRQAGYGIVFATARPFRIMGPLVERIPVDALIVHNGAKAYVDGVLQGDFGIEASTVRLIVDRLLAAYPGLRLSVEIAERHYANYDASLIWPGMPYEETDFQQLAAGSADKIIVTGPDGRLPPKVERFLPGDIYYEVSEGTVGLVLSKRATKWNALSGLAGLWGVDSGDIIAFGDDLNDICMLEGAGTGIAVKNALPQVKAVADSICERNAEDGVARWLEKNLLSRYSQIHLKQ